VRLAGAVTGLLLAAGAAAGQERPRLEVELRPSGPDPPRLAVQMRGLLADGQVLGAMRSGFPLYVALTVELRERRSLWDRTVDRWVKEYVVLHDPVRDVYVLDDPDGTEEIPDTAVLARKLEAVYVVELAPAGPGRHHYRATARARTLSDEDVDEVYAWLRGDDAEQARRNRPGFFARAARRVLVQVAPLPRITLEGRSGEFEVK
jgi:hypothetical protein